MSIRKNKSFVFITSPKRLILAARILIIVGLFLNIFFSCSQKRDSLISNGKAPEDHFLENLMIREWGLYTLLGSKPVTIFDIESSGIETEEDLRNAYEELKALLEKAESEKNLPEEERTASNPEGIILPDFEEYKKGWEDGHQPINHKRLWEQWNQNQRNLDPKFLILSISLREKHKVGLFINIPNLIYTLYHYQAEFSQRAYPDNIRLNIFKDLLRTGIIYDPQSIVHEIKNEHSLFWKNVFQDHFLIGLICGYGEKSAYLFDWSNKNLPGVSKTRRNFFWNDLLSKRDIQVRNKKMVHPKDLSVPIFFHFGLIDYTQINYELERQKIIEFFDNKEFTQETLKILLGTNDYS